MSVLERGPVRLFVPGRPRTKGSMTPQVSRGAGGKMRVHLVESGEYSVPWKRTMIRGIWEACGITPIRRGAKIIGFEPAPYAGPVEVSAVFLFQREIGVNGEVWSSHDTPYPTAKDLGDEDKLRRNLLDALTQSGLIGDDRLVVGTADGALNGKRWAGLREREGVLINVRTV